MRVSGLADHATLQELPPCEKSKVLHLFHLRITTDPSLWMAQWRMLHKTEKMKHLDRHYFSSWPNLCSAEFYGVDISKPATSYAKSVGLIKDAVNTNLEAGRPMEAERAMLRDADVIISTGCVGYISHRTFAQVLQCQTDRTRPPPVVAVFVLRMYSYDAIADELGGTGSSLRNWKALPSYNVAFTRGKNSRQR